MPTAPLLRDVGVPVVAVLGNHDYECGNDREVTAVVRDAGVQVLDGTQAEDESAGRPDAVVERA